MGFKLNIATISLLLILTSTARAQSGVFDVRNYGAQANGDITLALGKAWEAACASPSKSIVVVPAGTYRLGAANLQGPCKSHIEVQVQGTLQAPGDPSFFKDASWVTLERIDSLTLSGGGTFDGQGKTAWGKNDCSKNKFCSPLPINIRLNFVTNSEIRDITSLDSKQFHINVLGCQNVTFRRVTITAPEDSLNTDGIHIGRSTGIRIIDSHIGTGDDCVSLGDGSKDIVIKGVSCGPGHGISIGSLGKYDGEEPVVGVKVIGCTLTKTMNGVRIKTWPNSFDGAASHMRFENITMDNVANPIIIDQLYCPYNQCQAEIPSKIKISKVSFENIRGTTTTKQAVQLHCSKALPCQNVQLRDIDLAYNGNDGAAISECINVTPNIDGIQNPPACSVKA